MAQKKYLSSGQLSETEPNTKLILESSEPLLYLEVNKPNKQNVYEINSSNKFNVSQSSFCVCYTFVGYMYTVLFNHNMIMNNTVLKL